MVIQDAASHAENCLDNGRKHWSKEDDQFLKEYYLELPMKSLIKKLGRSRSAITTRAVRKFNLRRNGRLTEIRAQILEKLYIPLSEFDLGYIIGTFESDGCISRFIGNNKEVKYQFRIINTDIEYLKNCQRLIGGRVIKGKNLPPKDNYKRKPLHYLAVIDYVTLFRLLNTIYPYLIVKKNDVKVALDWLKDKLHLPEFVIISSYDFQLEGV